MVVVPAQGPATRVERGSTTHRWVPNGPGSCPLPTKPQEHESVSVTDNLQTRTVSNLPDDWTELDRRAVDTIRVLAAEAVQHVGNGHPGTAMSLAPTAYALFQRVM